jgi:hypothetical protein
MNANGPSRIIYDLTRKALEKNSTKEYEDLVNSFDDNRNDSVYLSSTTNSTLDFEATSSAAIKSFNNHHPHLSKRDDIQ